MPIYEYTCQDCSHTTEALRPASQADSPIPCQACQSTNTQRAQSTFAARTNSPSASPLPATGGCGCGNPHGPCNS